MKIHKSLRGLAVGAMAALSAAMIAGGAFAATGGGATIHNSATLTYNGGLKVTDWVNVGVLTIGTAPAVTLTSVGPFELNAGESVTLNYTITANANGSDSYSLSTATSGTTGMTAGTTFTPSTNTVTLGASVTVAPSAMVDGDTGTVFIPTGSQTNLSPGDTVVLGGFVYTVEAVRVGVVASTTGNTTTSETHTEVDLTVPLASGSPAIGNATVATGTQFGERRTFSVDVTVTSPTVVGVDGTVNPIVTGNTSALDTGNLPVAFTSSGANNPDITVLSATVTILKEARNITKGGAYAGSGVTAQGGDTLEYRITMTATTGGGDAIGSVLTDVLPEYTDYVPNSTTLNGVAVPDDVGVLFPLSSVNAGISVNSVNGAAGVLVDGDTGVNAATVVFRVTVQ